MDVWADTPDDQRDKFLRELSEPDKHRFIIAYAGFQHWTVFREMHEMVFHQAVHQMAKVVTPANEDETAFVRWATDRLTKAWRNKRRTKDAIVTIHEGDPASFGIDFGHYPISTDETNIDAWAGLWLRSYRDLRDTVMDNETGRTMDHETAMGVVAGQRIRVRLMKIADE
jgi:hypothetical protein